MLAAMAAAIALSQDSPPRLAFDVVSVKPAGQQSGRMGRGIFTYPGGRVEASSCPLDYFISVAFDIQAFQISGAPAWFRSDRWDIEAKPPEGAKSSKANPNSPKLPPNPEQQLMMQTLLADQFHLRYHRETKEGPVYFLVRTNKDLKLKESANKEEFPWVGSAGGGGLANDGIWGMNATMLLMAARLSARLDRPVIDKTGLEGAYDFKFVLDKDSAPETDTISAILTSVQALGLKLEAGKGPVETLIIDSAEKPSGN
jgi:uncharacterized protein (TIGR03435 family)